MSTPDLPPVPPEAAGRPLGEALSPELLASLLADGDDELAAWALREAIREGSRIEAYEGILADAMRLVGERWATGQWSVAEEHLASQTLLRALDRIRPDLGPDSRIGPLAVLAGVAGEDHMIGLVCLDHLLRERGWTVANLGADVPAADLGRFVERNDARLVALTASDPSRAGDIADAVSAVRGGSAERPDRQVPIVLGGRIAAAVGDDSQLGIDRLVRSLSEALEFADGVLVSLSTAEA
jgi:methanogenic corrinoid protein MtbC1